MHNTYKETLTVWPVNDATGLHLFSTRKPPKHTQTNIKATCWSQCPSCQPEPSGIAWD